MVTFLSKLRYFLIVTGSLHNVTHLIPVQVYLILPITALVSVAHLGIGAVICMISNTLIKFGYMILLSIVI